MSCHISILLTTQFEVYRALEGRRNVLPRASACKMSQTMLQLMGPYKTAKNNAKKLTIVYLHCERATAQEQICVRTLLFVF